VSLTGSVSPPCTLVGWQETIGIYQLFESVSCRLAGGSGSRCPVGLSGPSAVGCYPSDEDTVRSIKG
jgi:hypothetical protein